MNDNKLITVKAADIANIAIYGIIACLVAIFVAGAKFGVAESILLQNALIATLYVFCLNYIVMQYLGGKREKVLMGITGATLISIIVSLISGFYYIIIFELLFYIVFFMFTALLKSNIDKKEGIAESNSGVDNEEKKKVAENAPTISDILAKHNRGLLSLIIDAENMQIDNIVEVKLKAYTSILCNYYITKDANFAQMSAGLAKECEDILELYVDLRNIDDKSDNLEVLQRIVNIHAKILFA
jgi:hypothetical protein